MGQKINPQSLRIGVTKDWASRWYFSSLTTTEKGQRKLIGRNRVYPKLLEEDEVIRRIVKERISLAGIAGVLIERTVNDVKIWIKAAKPGLIIGRGGKGIEELTTALEDAMRKLRGESWKVHMSVNVEELKRSEVSAIYTAQQVAWDLEKRMPYRRTIKKYLEQISQNREVKGVKIFLSGRLGGAEIARRESLKYGALPLQTLRADIDYGQGTAHTAYGTIGIKVWIYKGETTPTKGRDDEKNNSRRQ